MADFDARLTQALAENGPFDADRAQRLAAELVDAYRKRMRRVERHAWIYILVTTAIGVFAFMRMVDSYETRELVLYGMLLAFALAIQVLTKLWYWVVNNKISVLKELKVLRLSAGSAGDADELARAVAAVSSTDVTGVTRGWRDPERIAWLVAIAIVCGFVSVLARRPATVFHSDRYVSVAADGSAVATTKRSFPFRDVRPLTSIPHRSGVAVRSARAFDGRGRELHVGLTPIDTGTQLAIDLIEPALPGEHVAYKLVEEYEAFATREDDVWTCRGGGDFHYASNEYDYHVLLPRGADIVSVEPEPTSRFTVDGGPGVRFHVRKSDGERFVYTIRYRLPPADS